MNRMHNLFILYLLLDSTRSIERNSLVLLGSTRSIERNSKFTSIIN